MTTHRAGAQAQRQTACLAIDRSLGQSIPPLQSMTGVTGRFREAPVSRRGEGVGRPLATRENRLRRYDGRIMFHV
jgi:hypothetical protein